MTRIDKGEYYSSGYHILHKVKYTSNRRTSCEIWRAWIHTEVGCHCVYL